MVSTRSQNTKSYTKSRVAAQEPQEPDLCATLHCLLYLCDSDQESKKKFRDSFNRICRFYSDDISNVLGFWTDNGSVTYYPRHSVRDYKLVVMLIDYAGLEHPLMRAQLHKYDRNALNLLGVVRYTRKSAEGDTVVHYRFKAGECV